jgi:hypothetical protein
VPAPSGVAIFSDGPTALGNVPISGGHASLTTSSLAVGTHRIQVRYPGDSIYAASNAALLTLIVAAKHPTIGGLSQSHKVWRLGSKRARLSKGHKLPIGTTFRFKLDTAATVRFRFRRCVSRVHGGRRCKRSVTAGTLSLKKVQAGQHKLSFQGRLKGRRRLKPGRYTLVITASTPGGRSSRSIKFTALR